ncbi:hypothetical protein [Halobacteriovorax sp. Y22]|uniref:hypothetical protein n=1 Tax=Halobacteriovorax sp. Y22 TaxID=2505978 RepID=UPI0010803EBD|nr:hypothetical protein [Halobacteriovorax sp. Y22]TGD46438.1 hypothetical protein EP118_11915 [Halobacteriovorax sp. Y22]
MSKFRKLFTYSLIPISLIVLIACLGRGHNLRTTSSEVVKTNEGAMAVDRSPASTYVEGVESLTIGNYFDITNDNSKEDTDGFIQEGAWFQDELRGSGGSISRYSVDPTAQSIYLTDQLGDSTYCIWLYRVTSPDATESAFVDIFDGTEQIGVASVNMSLPTDRKGWYPLGEFTFTNEQEAKVIVYKGIEDLKKLRADEVRFSRLEENEDCQGRKYVNVNKEAVIFAKGMDEKSFTSNDGYREYVDWQESNLKGYQESTVRMSEDEYAYAIYSFIPKNRNYCIDIYRVTTIGGLSNAKVTVFQEDIEIFSRLINYNMKSGKGGWYPLGKQSVEPDTMVSVILERDPLDIGILLSDAVRIYECN